ncbi:MAG: D-arabinose 5-phosphate isomerase, partial [bacterium (Candidatus Ratteibacteria) CG15_BIG_FIL_POST_REV_8_21_14_020_41_12]
MKSDHSQLLKLAKEVLRLEANAISSLIPRINQEFAQALNLLFSCKSRVVITGMGKSGIIGRKIAATLSSTGTPSLFLHPGEAIHGDLGMIIKDDVVLAISNSGETEEIIKILPFLKRTGVKIIGLTGDTSSQLAKASNVVLNVKIKREACPFGLVPTASTTAILAMGDALAMALLKKRGLGRKDFALFHPGGNLGKRLLQRVKDVMQTGKKMPIVPLGASLKEAITEINRKKLGFTLVVDQKKRLIGIITDGDLRRFLIKRSGINGARVVDCMAGNPMTIREEALAAQAITLMEKKAITSLAIINKER